MKGKDDELTMQFSFKVLAKGKAVRSLTKPVAFVLVAVGILTLVLAATYAPELKTTKLWEGLRSIVGR